MQALKNVHSLTGPYIPKIGNCLVKTLFFLFTLKEYTTLVIQHWYNLFCKNEINTKNKKTFVLRMRVS